MKTNSICAGLLVIGAALCGLSGAASAQTLEDAGGTAANLVGSMKADADCGPLPYEGITQKGKWAIELDDDRYQKGMFEVQAQSLSLLDFSAHAAEVRDRLNGAEAALRRDEQNVRDEVRKAGLSLKIEDLTIRKLQENVDYRVVGDRCGASAGVPY